MFRFKQLLEEHADEVVAAITNEHGKVLDDAMGEFVRGVEVVEYACGIPELLKGEHSRNVGPKIDSWSEFQPLGVVAGITPFNFPAMVPMWMYPMAIACGNTFVLKPSEKDPTAPMLCARLLKEAGLPDGVFNLVNGDKEAVDTLLHDPRVQAVSFVGSTPIAEYIYSTGTANGKRVQALGGAKNHAIVMPDADIDNAVSALMGAAYGSCGERCMAISVAVCVGDETANAVVGKFKSAVADMKVGNGNDTSNDMGPLVTKVHHDKVRSYVDLGVEEGADLVIDGRDLEVEGHDDGFFLGPCLFDNVQAHMRIYQEEIFGPCCASCAPSPRSTRCAHRRARVRQRHLYLHARRRGARDTLPTTSRSAWSASTSPYRCRLRTTVSAAGSVPCSATCMPMARTACASTRAARRSRSAGHQAACARKRSSRSRATNSPIIRDSYRFSQKTGTVTDLGI